MRNSIRLLKINVVIKQCVLKENYGPTRLKELLDPAQTHPNYVYAARP